MKRREFISLIRAGTRAWPLAARAQQPDPVQRIGVLMHLAADDPEGKSRLAAFLQGPREAGWAVAFFVMFLFGLVVLTGLPAHASEKLWRDALSASRCFADPPEQESVLLIASAWEGKSLPQLFKDAGWKDVQKSLANDGDFSSVFQERKKQLVGQVLSSTQQGLDRFKRDVATKNPITCLIASFQAAENLQIVAQDQANAGAARQPYLKVAQYVLKLQGCRIETGEGGSPSGLFGKASRKFSAYRCGEAENWKLRELGFSHSGRSRGNGNRDCRSSPLRRRRRGSKSTECIAFRPAVHKSKWRLRGRAT